MKTVILFLVAVSVMNPCRGQGMPARPDRGVFIQVMEKFYSDLAKKEVTMIAPFVLHRSAVDIAKCGVYGEALVRSPEGPKGISSVPAISTVENIREPFKMMTGCDLVDYQVYIVRYPLPPRVAAAFAERGTKPMGKLFQHEQAFCDLWMYGSDGKWRVACNYSPSARVDAQTLGLSLMADKAEGEKLQAGYVESQKSWEDLLVGPEKK